MTQNFIEYQTLNLPVPASCTFPRPISCFPDQNSSFNNSIVNLLTRYQIQEVSNNNANLQCASNAHNDDNPGLEIDSLFYEFQLFATNGCTFSENVAKNYSRRPCFKKIELLLSRLKQELNVNHNILSNINSQGTAWAIKDFIFVFSRIINAWTVMRRYIYDKSQGIQNLRKDFDPNFIESFIQWQEVTLKMMRTLMGTVENLNVVAQNKSENVHIKQKIYVETESRNIQYDKTFLENVQRNLFMPKFSENLEEVRIQNHETDSCFQSGYLKPLKIRSYETPSSDISSNNSPCTPTTPDSDTFNWMNYDFSNELNFPSSTSSQRLYNRRAISISESPKDLYQYSNEKSRAKKDLSVKFNSIAVKNCKDVDVELNNTEKLRMMLFENDFGRADGDKLKKIYIEDSIKINYFINEVSKVPCDETFAPIVKIIVENIKNGKYEKFDEILREFKDLVETAKSFIENSKDEKTQIGLKKFINRLEAAIKRF